MKMTIRSLLEEWGLRPRAIVSGLRPVVHRGRGNQVRPRAILELSKGGVYVSGVNTGNVEVVQCFQRELESVMNCAEGDTRFVVRCRPHHHLHRSSSIIIYHHLSSLSSPYIYITIILHPHCPRR